MGPPRSQFSSIRHPGKNVRTAPHPTGRIFTFLGAPLNLNPNLNLDPLPRLKIKSKIRIKITKSEKTVP